MSLRMLLLPRFAVAERGQEHHGAGTLAVSRPFRDDGLHRPRHDASGGHRQRPRHKQGPLQHPSSQDAGPGIRGFSRTDAQEQQKGGIDHRGWPHRILVRRGEGQALRDGNRFARKGPVQSHAGDIRIPRQTLRAHGKGLRGPRIPYPPHREMDRRRRQGAYGHRRRRGNL